MTGFALRLARPEDAEPGADMHLASWAESYQGLIPPGPLERVLADRDRWVAAWREQLALAPRWLAESPDGELVGFASAGPDIVEPGSFGLQLYAIYVRSAWHGAGVGQALLDAAIGDAPCSVWVLEHNPRAHAFYARNGFTADGTRMYDERLEAWEVRLVRGSDEVG